MALFTLNTLEEGEHRVEKMDSKKENQPNTQKRIIRFIPVLIPVVLLGAIWGLAGTIKDEKEQLAAEKLEMIAAERAPANVVVLDLQPVEMKDQINLPGVIEPWKELSVLSRVEGIVTEMEVVEGEAVKKGQLLARLDPADFRITYNSARAEYELASANKRRMASLYAKKIIPAAEMEEVEAMLKTRKARLDKARLLLSRCEIKAPLSGVIHKLHAKEGLLLNASDPVAEILQIDRLKAVVGIPESDVALVRTIKNVALTIQALDNRQAIGRYHFLASAPDSDARLYRLELEIENADRAILPGMFFRAQVVKRVIEGAISVPLFSIIQRKNSQFVFIEENGVAKQIPVKLGILEDWMVQVTEGVLPGSRLVVEGHRNIDQGFELNVVRVASSPEEVIL